MRASINAKIRVYLRQMGLGAVLALALNSGFVQAQELPVAVEVQDEQELYPDASVGKIEKAIVEALDRINKRFKLDATTDLRGVNERLVLGASWQRGIEPAYSQKNSSFLIDTYRLRADLTGLGLYQETNDDIFGIAPTGEIEISYARLFPGRTFKEQMQMLIKKPYLPFKHLPITAKRAMNLKEGDIVFLKSNLNLVMRGSTLRGAGSSVPIIASAYYMVSGEFNVHLFRLPGNKFRVKFIGVRSKGGGMSALFGFDSGKDIKVSKLDFIGLDNQIEKALRFEAIDIKAWKESGNAFMIDYELDFNEEDVQAAYNEVLENFLRPKILKVMNPLTNRAELRAMLVSEIDSLERIYERDRDKSVEQRKVERPFSGELDYSRDGISIQLGQRNIGYFGASRSYAENKIFAFDRYNNRRHFILPVYAMSDFFGGLIGYFGTEVQRTASLLLETDDKFVPNQFAELAFHFAYTDKKFTKEEVENLKGTLKVQLPYGLYDQINWMSWSNLRDRVNARITTLLVFKPSALNWFANLGGGEFYSRLVAFGRAFKGSIGSIPSDVPHGEEWRYNAADFSDRYHHDLLAITHGLALTFNEHVESHKRLDAFLGLRSNPLWQEIGSRFLIWGAFNESKNRFGEKAEEEFKKNIYFETQWQAKGEDTVFAAIGDCRNRRLYRAAMYLYATLNNRSLDLRLIDGDQTPELPDKDKDYDCGLN